MKVRPYILCPKCKSEAYEKELEGKKIYFCETCKVEIKRKPLKCWSN